MGVAQERRPRGLSLHPYLSVHWSGKWSALQHTSVTWEQARAQGCWSPASVLCFLEQRFLLNTEESGGENVQGLNSQKS